MFIFHQALLERNTSGVWGIMLSEQLCEVNSRILQRRKWRCREVKWRAYGHTAEKCGVQIWAHAV